LKICLRCQKKRRGSSFNQNRTNKDGLQRYCRACQARIERDYYARNQVQINLRRKGLVDFVLQRNRAYLLAHLLLHPCVDCGEKNPVVLEYDHVRGKKKRAVTALVLSKCSLKTLIEEISKCDVRCANCHRKRTLVGTYRFGSPTKEALEFWEAQSKM